MAAAGSLSLHDPHSLQLVIINTFVPLYNHLRGGFLTFLFENGQSNYHRDVGSSSALNKYRTTHRKHATVTALIHHTVRIYGSEHTHKKKCVAVRHIAGEREVAIGFVGIRT